MQCRSLGFFLKLDYIARIVYINNEGVKCRRQQSASRGDYGFLIGIVPYFTIFRFTNS